MSCIWKTAGLKLLVYNPLFKHSCNGKPEQRTTALTILALEKWPQNPDLIEGDTALPGPDQPPGLLQGPAGVRG